MRRRQPRVLQVHVGEAGAERRDGLLGALTCEQGVSCVQTGPQARVRLERAGDLLRPRERSVPVVLHRHRGQLQQRTSIQRPRRGEVAAATTGAELPAAT